ncbi:DUF3489 domain-containing protein [Sphingorhabdus soli]|uniref:DUF3489 domain-containing protein n=1 Tax=Flavisphingopyxis soli TaxID=2601267 RepID=A0A5C6ULJ7_9SPHN|nr:DUF3489 domain-containing protein [Sphingorhabdus soli]TXC73364.1 DUF3489 domain-containing protein [Sphingorhabdus soli]
MTTNTDASKAPAKKPTRDTKIGKVVALLKRKDGATLAQLIKATGWQKHTVRASLTGLKKKGHAIERSAIGGTSRYAICDAASQ